MADQPLAELLLREEPVAPLLRKRLSDTVFQVYTGFRGLLKQELIAADAYYAKAFTQTLIEGKKLEAIEAYQKAGDLYQQQNKPTYSQNARKKIEELRVSESP